MVDPRSTAHKLSRQFVTTFGENVRSVVLFGSVTRGEAIPGMSDINMLILLDSMGAREMAQAAPLAQAWISQGNTPPSIFSAEEWEGMRDTFAIELADMHDAREVIHGDDPVAGNAPSRSDLRLHAEREVRETVLQLRLRMLLTANVPRELGRLLVAGLPSFSSYGRSALRLADQDAPMETEAVLERVAPLVGADAAPLLRCQEARRDLRPPEVTITDPLVEGYLAFGQSLMRYIDQLP